jgi:hypothetical protein
MNADEFVRAIGIAVRDTSIKGVIEALSMPPGRKPDPEKLRLAEWFNALNDADKENIRTIVNSAVDSTVFGFLCVLDGVVAIEEAGPKGDLELWYVRDENRVQLNESMDLHDIYRAEPARRE